MIGKLTGKIDACFDDHLLIDVGGVGYLVYCATKNLHQFNSGDFCQLFIETHVREDHIHLYGFKTIEEKQFFILLQSVNGIGARMALAVLSHLSPSEIQLAVAQKNKEAFRAISGVGPKLAERILIELKDKVNHSSLNYLDTKEIGVSSSASINLVNDAVSALTNLGINKMEAQNAVSKVLAIKPDASIDELIRLALRNRG